MGLCKCPKRQVTNQFCFEHRVNVCEHCMVTNHPKCVIQSYLQWLQDSDYDPNCQLCGEDLATAECLRLVCYHVYHWSCFNNYACSLPGNTAPAGFTCPTCSAVVFPAHNLVSPVADHLRQILSRADWAREGLGVPLLDDYTTGEGSADKDMRSDVAEFGSSRESINSQLEKHHGPTPHERPPPTGADDSAAGCHSVIQMDSHGGAFNRGDMTSSGGNGRKMSEKKENTSFDAADHDDNKYKRRSALEWLARWWKTLHRPSPRAPRSASHLYKRYFMIVVLTLLTLLTIGALMSWFGRQGDDPMLDPRFNPHLRVEQAAR